MIIIRQFLFQKPATALKYYLPWIKSYSFIISSCMFYLIHTDSVVSFFL